MNPPVPSDYTALRHLAETRLLNNPALRSSPADGQNPALAHELAVQRIMFDLQYEELCAAYAEIQSGLERYQDLYDFAPIGFFNLATDGTIQLANLTAARLAGTERERLLGTPFSRLLVEQDRSEFSIFLERVNATGTRQACELLLLNLATPTVNVRLEATRSLDGREFRLAMLDITAHKLAESASVRLAAIVESSDDAIIGKDLNSIITSWNKGAERIFGYTAAEMVGASILKLIPADRRDEENLILGKIRRGECVEHFETLRQTKDGRLIDVSVTASPIKDANGRPIGVSKIARDITDRLKLELKLRQSQKMESIGQLAAGIAHDFNNILSIIFGNAYLAATDAGQPAKIQEHLKEITKAAQRATDLVNQILTFSRQKKPSLEAVSLNEVVPEALQFLRASLPATIGIQTSLPPVPAILANVTEIHQVIMNLATNAWQAIGNEAGTLKVELHVEAGDEDFLKMHPGLKPGKYVRMSMSDTGYGMDRATLERIFDPFFTTKAAGEGTGLGLAVVHGIMKGHEGDISVYSQPGEGTVFHLFFPANETGTVVHPPAPPVIPRGRGERILFVDDETSLARLGQNILERFGYAPTAVTSAQAALEAVQAEPGAFALVITDMTMPGMDGITLGGRLLALEPHLPVILMTGYSKTMTVEKVRALGFQDLLIKPVSARALGEVVHRALCPRS